MYVIEKFKLVNILFLKSIFFPLKISSEINSIQIVDRIVVAYVFQKFEQVNNQTYYSKGNSLLWPSLQISYLCIH